MKMPDQEQANAPVALLTGAARRLGAATARALHQRGHRLIIHYRQSADAALALQAELNALRPDSTRVLQADLVDDQAVIRLGQQALDCFQRLDLLVNNASSFYATPLQDASLADWDALFNSNVKAAYFLSQRLAPALSRHHGSIVNLCDINADHGMAGFSIYTMAKSALKSMTRSLARELAPSVRVNAVSPGAILWPEQHGDSPAQQAEQARILAGIPAGRLGSPNDIAAAVCFLGLDAHYVTGQTLSVDGGRRLSL